VIKKIISILFSSLLLFSLLSIESLGVMTVEASQKFHQGNLTTLSFKSPNRLEDQTTDVFPKINSAWNQPRNVAGSNPHEGVDIHMSAYTPVYPAFEGTVADRGTNWIQIKHANGFYMTYTHVYPKVSKGNTVSMTTIIGEIENIKGAHLHFGLNTNTSSTYSNLIWAANNRPYSHVAEWNYGRGLDFIKRHWFTDGHILNIYVYASDDADKAVKPQKVYLYHRKSGTTSWRGPVTMKQTCCTNEVAEHRYNYDFGALGYYNYDKVDWLVVGYRNGDFSPNWAYYPAYYASPSEAPDGNSKYYTVTLTGLPEPLETQPLEEVNGTF
jgi:hypothetical protein